MAKRDEVDISSLMASVSFGDDMLDIAIQFRKRDSGRTYVLRAALDRIRMEVTVE